MIPTSPYITYEITYVIVFYLFFVKSNKIMTKNSPIDVSYIIIANGHNIYVYIKQIYTYCSKWQTEQ